jgi:membrane protease YdiL (CAAX protease family)
VVLENANQSESNRSTTGWRNSRWLILCEFLIVVLIFIADWKHLIPFSKTPFLLLLGWVSLRLRKIGWKAVGFTRYKSWTITLLLGIAGGVAIEAFELFVSHPLLVWLTGKQPDLDDFRILTGNIKITVVALVLAWTFAAFGEELVYRGYLMNRFADLDRHTRRAWICSLIVISIVFAFAHTYQGVTGVVEAGIDGLFLAIMYLRTDRNLLVPIIAHGVQDTVDVLLIFLGKYPGM